MKHGNRKKQRHIFLFHVEEHFTEKRSSLQPLMESIRVAVSLVVVAVLFDIHSTDTSVLSSLDYDLHHSLHNKEMCFKIQDILNPPVKHSPFVLQTCIECC
jgi:hypothetical protein